MTNFHRANECLKFMDKKHIGGCEDLKFSEIINRPERRAYWLVHEGDSAQAMAVRGHIKWDIRAV